MHKNELQKKWTLKAREILKFRKIIDVQYIEGDEYMRNYGLALLLDNETTIYVMSDDEGNDWGALHYILKDGKQSILPTL